MNEVFEMDLWQLICYMDGYNIKYLNNKIDNIILANNIGMYTGQYFVGKKAPDPRHMIDEYERQKQYFNSPKKQSSTEDSLEKIRKLKETLKYFKK